MRTGIEYTKMVKHMLKEAMDNGRYLYMGPVANGNPSRIIRVETVRGLTIAHTITGGNFPISNLNFDKLYIQ